MRKSREDSVEGMYVLRCHALVHMVIAAFLGHPYSVAMPNTTISKPRIYLVLLLLLLLLLGNLFCLLILKLLVHFRALTWFVAVHPGL